MSSGPQFMTKGITSEKIEEFGDLEEGDHLAVKCTHLRITYFHHGILTSKINSKVVHFSGPAKSEAKIEIIDLMKFLKDDTGFKILYRIRHTERESREQTIETALAYVGKEMKTWKKYDLLTNNCEHFATYCVTGKKYSAQVSELVEESLQKVIKLVGAPFLKPLS